jgi:hypothetical protein
MILHCDQEFQQKLTESIHHHFVASLILAWTFVVHDTL